MIFHTRKKTLIIFLFTMTTVITGLVNGNKSYGYIMPAEQLIEFMTKNFRKFQTVEILHSTFWNRKVDGSEGKDVLEHLKLKSPDLLYYQTIEGDREYESGHDRTYLQLLISNKKERIESLLSRMGINLHSVAFTRFDGSIAYRIGNKSPESPQILIEKDRFIPLYLTYMPPGSQYKEAIHITFEDYRELDQGWYPFRITYSSDLFEEIYSVDSIQVNINMDSTIFKSSGADLNQPKRAKEKPIDGPDTDRLKRIIEVFEEKYQ